MKYSKLLLFSITLVAFRCHQKSPIADQQISTVTTLPKTVLDVDFPLRLLFEEESRSVEIELQNNQDTSFQLISLGNYSNTFGYAPYLGDLIRLDSIRFLVFISENKIVGGWSQDYATLHIICLSPFECQLLCKFDSLASQKVEEDNFGRCGPSFLKYSVSEESFRLEEHFPYNSSDSLPDSLAIWKCNFER